MEAPGAARALGEKIERKLKNLPMLPSGVGELISLDARAEDYAARVIDIAEREPALAAKLLSVANGAVMAPAKPITGLREALVRLGARRVASLITSFGMMRVFAPSTEGHRNLWRHAVQTATASQESAGAGGAGVDPELAYAAGLLHDIGQFVMLECDAGALEPETADWIAPQSLIAVERERWGIDHCDVGYKAGRSWWLPRELVEVLRLHHHHGSLQGEAAGPIVTLVRVVQQASSLSHLLLRASGPLLGLEPKHLVPKLGFHCVCPTWGKPPLSAQELCARLPAVHARACEQIALLGLEHAA